MTYWQMWLHPDNKNWSSEDILNIIKQKGVIGMGSNQSTGKSFQNKMNIGDIVVIRHNKSEIAIVEVTGEFEQSSQVDDKLDWFQLRRSVKLLATVNNLRLTSNRNVLYEVNSNEIIHITNYLKGQAMQEKINILKQKKQIILQGAPGTGKTYLTSELAVALIDEKYSKDRDELMKRYQELVDSDRIFFTTFHQSMDYEEFVEGFKPTENGFSVKDGIFKKACEKALTAGTGKIGIDEAMEKFIELIENSTKENPFSIDSTSKETKYTLSITDNGHINFSSPNAQNTYYRTINGIKSCYTKFNDSNHMGIRPYQRSAIQYMIENLNLLDPNTTPSSVPVVLIIDEINRGNISKIFGELITLLEVDKRTGGINEVKAELPYSGESFSVPPNLYIIGTMNTADRTISYIDYALRRRFAFITIEADESTIKNDKALELFTEIRDSIITRENLAEEFEVEDLMIGHSYFIVADDEELKIKLEYEIKPLLLEYLKDGILNNTPELKEQIKKLSV